MKSVVFCLPAYNEEKIMEDCTLRLLDYLKAREFPWSWRIAILVNGSKDKSAEIAEKLASKNPEISAAIYPAPGRGQTMRDYWSKCSDDILSYMDIDLAVSLDDIPKLINPLAQGEADLTVGSRLIPGSKTDRSLLRHITSYAYSFVAQFILFRRLPDLQCGFKAINKETFQKVSPYSIEKHWFFDTEIIVFAKLFGYKVKAVPVDWQEGRFIKRATKVKLLHDSLKFIKDLWHLKLRLREYKKSR